MDRRVWLASCLGLFAASLLGQARAQPRAFRIGLLGGSPPTGPDASPTWAGFFQGLRELGYVEGQNVVIEGRYYGDRTEELPALAAELVRLQVDVIVAGATPAPEAASRATSTIPIVMASHADPVGSGLVASLPRPGGNITGLSVGTPALRGKQLQLLKEMVPRLVRVAVLSNPAIPFRALDLSALEAAAQSLKVELQMLEARAPSEFDAVFLTMKGKRAGALLVLGGSMFFAHRATLGRLAAKSRLPAMYGAREYVEAGGLMAYAPNGRESFRRAAGYVDRILRGAKPGDLPVEQPTAFDLVVNRTAAKALGLSIPASVLALAEQVIE